MKTFLITQIIKEEIELINSYKRNNYSNDDIRFIFEISSLTNQSIITEINIQSIIKKIVEEIKRIIYSKKINLNVVKVIIQTTKSIKIPNTVKKFILSIISLILVNSALSSVAMAAENPSEARDAFSYAAGCIAIDANANPDIDNKHILIKLQKLARLANTQKSLDSLDANSKDITFDTIKWVYNQLGDLQQEYKDIIKSMNKISLDMTNQSGENVFSYLQEIGFEALKATDGKYQFKVTSMITSSDPLESSFETEESPTWGGSQNNLPSHWSK